MRALGVEVEDDADDELVVHGVGLRGLRAGRRSTAATRARSMRLLVGIARRPGRQLRARPATSRCPRGRWSGSRSRCGGWAPRSRRSTVTRRSSIARLGALQPIALRAAGGERAGEVRVLLAGLYADGPTTVVEPVPTRDHTERLLEGARRARRARARRQSTVEPAGALAARRDRGPGRHLLGRAVSRRGRAGRGLRAPIHGVKLNPRRTGLLDVLERMGARIAIFNRRRSAASRRRPRDRSAELERDRDRGGRGAAADRRAAAVRVLAVHARGESVVRGAQELRAKETDRIEAVTDGLRPLGGRIRARPDGFAVRGVPARLQGRPHRRARRPSARDARGDRGPRLARRRGDRGAEAVA